MEGDRVREIKWKNVGGERMDIYTKKDENQN